MEDLIYIANIAVYIMLVVFFPVYFTFRCKLGFINPVTVPFFIFSPVLLLKSIGGPLYILPKGLFDPWYNFAILMENIHLLITSFQSFIVVEYCRRKKYHPAIVFFDYKLKTNRMALLSVFFLFMFFVCFFLLSRDFGFFNWILNPREGYQFHRVGSGHWYALSILFLSLSFVFCCSYVKRNNLLFLVFVFYALLSFLLGSKGIILSYFISFVVILWFRRYKYLFHGLVLLCPLVFSAMLINFSNTDLTDVLMYFDYYVNSSMYYEAFFSGDIDLFYGDIMLTEFYSYIPRALFPEKPFVYGFLLVNEHFFPGAAEATHTPAFGGPINYFADFHVFGVILFSIMDFSNILSVYLMYRLYLGSNFEMVKNSSSTFFVYMWFIAPSFMMFFGAGYILIILISLYFLVFFVNRLKVRL
ncbi:hypothetical protein VCSRO125_2350 [Vibrio cholerae]|nr:putative O-antigen polymerase [Vibrio cholerae]GHZ48425.1 hypothetical protein VCSRO125_2350 [Vibrio cholerae]